MITKTYLDGKLRSLEERLEKRIDLKDSRVSQGIEANIAELKNSVRSIEEKAEENKDIIRGYLESQNDLKQELEKFKLRIINLEKKLDLESNENGSDEIVSDI